MLSKLILKFIGVLNKKIFFFKFSTFETPSKKLYGKVMKVFIGEHREKIRDIQDQITYRLEIRD